MHKYGANLCNEEHLTGARIFCESGLEAQCVEKNVQTQGKMQGLAKRLNQPPWHKNCIQVIETF